MLLRSRSYALGVAVGHAARSLLVGGALVGGAVLRASIGGARRPRSRRRSVAQSYRLVLDTESDPACVYGSAWNDGDVVMLARCQRRQIVRFTSRYDFKDGCTWEATETLTPSESGYDYEYSEHAVECQRAKRAGAGVPAARARHGRSEPVAAA